MNSCIDRLRDLDSLHRRESLGNEEFSREVLDVLAEHLREPMDAIQAAYVVNLLARIREFDESDTAACDEIIGYFRSGADGGAVDALAAPFKRGVSSRVVLVGDLKRLTLWYTILIAVGVPLSFVPSASLLGTLMVVAGMLTGMALLFTCWHHLQDGNAPAPPLKSVGLLLVPLFNLYWFFVAVHGLTGELARRCRELDASVEPPSRILSLAFCLLVILPTLTLVPAMAILLSNPLETLAAGTEPSPGAPVFLALGLVSTALATAVGSYIVSIFMYRDITRVMVPVLIRQPRPTRPPYASLAILAAGAAGAYFALGFLAGVLALGEMLGPLYAHIGFG